MTTPLDEKVIALERMDGHETLGQPFSYDLALVSTDPNIDLSKLLGQPMTVHVKLPAGGTRHFNGIVTRATHLDVEEGYARYAVTLQPWLALLDYQSDCRIFQNQSIPDILKEVFRRADFSDFEDSLDDGAYGKLEYVVQYRESDFNFVSRLMEHAGIYYFFTHDDGKHTLVLADSQSAHDTVDDYDEVEFMPQKETSRGEKEHLSSWVVAQQIRSGGYAATDFDFKAPRTALLSALSQPQNYAHADTELFDYPGDFLKKADGDARVKSRLEERQYEYEMVQALGDVRGLGSGDLFTLTRSTRATIRTRSISSSAPGTTSTWATSSRVATAGTNSGPASRCSTARFRFVPPSGRASFASRGRRPRSSSGPAARRSIPTTTGG